MLTVCYVWMVCWVFLHFSIYHCKKNLLILLSHARSHTLPMGVSLTSNNQLLKIIWLYEFQSIHIQIDTQIQAQKRISTSLIQIFVTDEITSWNFSINWITFSSHDHNQIEINQNGYGLILIYERVFSNDTHAIYIILYILLRRKRFHRQIPLLLVEI